MDTAQSLRVLAARVPAASNIRHAPASVLAYGCLAFSVACSANRLADYGIVWAQPEAHAWKSQIARWHLSAFGYFAEALNWPVFEQFPRVTRPLSNLFELFDTKFRIWLWQFVPPHPSLSLTWILTLVLCPLLLFSLLRRLTISHETAAIGTALYFANPGIMSISVMLFRPGKALANFVILLAMWTAARLDLAERNAARKVSILCGVLFIGFFVDESALIAYPAVILLGGWPIWRNWKALTLLAVLPPLYAVTVRVVVPWLTLEAGFADPNQDVYVPQARLTHLLLHPTGGDVSGILKTFVFNIQQLIVGSFGLVRPSHEQPLWYVIDFVAILIVGLLITSIAARHFGPKRGLRPLLLVSTLLLMAGVYEAVLSSTVGQGWGLYWYGVFCVPFLLLVFCTIADRAPRALAVLFTACVILANAFVFAHTNEAYKAVHYYSGANGAKIAEELTAIFTNDASRFSVALSDGHELRAKTLEVWRSRETHADVRDVPLELAYLLLELRISFDLSCPLDAESPTFNLRWAENKVRRECSRASLMRELSAWTAPIASLADNPEYQAAAALLGPWRIRDDELCGIVFNPADNKLVLINEFGSRAAATLEGDRIAADAWHTTGKLSPDRRMLSWGNGTVWRR